MRTFLALDLPNSVRQNVTAITSQLQAQNVSGINWVKPENLHITFQFIGDTQRHDLNDISDIIDEVFSGIDLPFFSLPKLEIIPARSPRIIWISLQTSEKRLFAASRKLRRKLQKLGYKIDHKSLKFHITLGRIKKTLPKLFIKEILTTELKMVEFQVQKATLYQSFLKLEGPIYEEIISYYFKKE